mgnify:CR=1 FL=1
MRHAYRGDEPVFASIDAVHEHLAQGCTRNNALKLRRAVEDAWAIRGELTRYPNAFHAAVQLKAMRADAPIIVAALFGTDVSIRTHSIDFVRERFGQEIASLTESVRWLNELTMQDAALVGVVGGARDQAETLRRMVLSMVEDIRVVLVKLAYRTQRLYRLAKSDEPDRVDIARETLLIYAPLANRLGLGQLKWELEDVAFRIVEPDDYKRVAMSLEENRAARECYVADFVAALETCVRESGIGEAQVFGRPKHIYSIWKKMRSKHIEFTDLFDVRAVRVLVENVQQCYAVLGAVHGIWQPIVGEFDDYIASPKPNGYRSLHTAVMGPAGKPVEVQIRTRDMNDHAENGIAAHWAYKEGNPVDTNLQKSINALRSLLDESDDEQLVEGFGQQLDAHRVYVFTPKGEVIDLVGGATPLDFAYQIHSEIGHRCRGAKVDGRIVPLTHELRNGERVEILTTREPSPSRDWLNRSLGYLKSSRARGKVRAFFNAQDHAQHVADGRLILERELKRLRATSVPLKRLVRRLRHDKATDLYAAIGRNEISLPQIVGAIDHLLEPIVLPEREFRLDPGVAGEVGGGGAVRVRGVGNLLTQIAVCCRPVPHDSIIGFITRGKGVSIHRADCGNVLNLPEHERERLVDVNWGEDEGSRYRVGIRIVAYDRQGLLRDISTLLSSQDVDVVGVNTASDPVEQIAEMSIALHIHDVGELAVVMDRLRQLRNVQSVERTS